MATQAPAFTKKIHFLTNVPQTISLRFAEGREQPSQFGGGIEYFYSTDDDRLMYLPPAAVEAMDAAGVGAHVPFQLTKKSMGRWEAKVLGDAPAARTANASRAQQDRQPDSTPQRLQRVLDAPRDEPDWLDERPAQSEASVILEHAIADAVAATKRSGITFSEESLRAFAITLFIEQNRKVAR